MKDAEVVDLVTDRNLIPEAIVHEVLNFSSKHLNKTVNISSTNISFINIFILQIKIFFPFSVHTNNRVEEDVYRDRSFAGKSTKTSSRFCS